MDRSETIALLRSLLARIEADGQTATLKADAAEERALRQAIEELGAAEADQGKARDGSSQRRIVVDTRSLDETHPEDGSSALCLDFGTAMSKAFAATSEGPLALSLGRQAGYSESEFAVPSSVYVSNDGRLFFGHEAISASDDEADDRRVIRTRLDSPKQLLSQGEIGDLSRKVPGREVNPTNVRLSYYDFITLFLAYLTDLAIDQLREKGVDSSIQRRIARPCWDSTRNAWADQALSEMCVAAQVLADTLHGKWNGGQLNVVAAHEALQEVRQAIKSKKVPDWLVSRSVQEPVAAGFARVFRGQQERRAFIVVDVGAGTTDFGFFVLANVQQTNNPVVALAKRSTHSLPQAGDRIDAILQFCLLRKHGVDAEAGEEGRLIALGVNRRIRRWKEELFRTKSLNYQLSNGIVGSLTLAEFQKDAHVVRFVGAIKSELIARLNSIDESWIKKIASRQPVQVVLTGGASTMPMLQNLASSKIKSQGCEVELTTAREFPDWIQEEQPSYLGAYRQLAVAIGGSAPDLPARLKELERFAGGEHKGAWVLESFQTKGV